MIAARTGICSSSAFRPGLALLRAGLARAAGQPCYLETATPSNVGLYQAHGFAVRNEWQHGDAPNFWSMWHPGSVTAAAQ